MEVIDELTDRDPGSADKQLKNFVTTGTDTISNPVIAKFISKIQVHLNHSIEVIVGAQAVISLLKSKSGDVPEYHTKIWCAMGDIMKKLISYGEILDNIDLDLIMNEAREAHLLTVKIKNYVDDAMTQETSASAKVVSIY